MAVYTIERANPLNPIAKCYISTERLGELNSISAKLKFVEYTNSDILTHDIDLLSNNDILIITENSNYEYVCSINKNSNLFKNFLVESNFFIELTSPTAEEEFILNYYVKPSTITLENISISTLDTSQYGTIGNKGIITNSGNCELWSDYDFAVFKTTLKRIYYNNDNVVLDGPYNNELSEKIQIAKENGGGRIHLTTTNSDVGIGPITFDSNGIFISAFNQDTDEYIEQYLGDDDNKRIINFVGINNSFMFNGFKFIEKEPENVKEIKINFHNSSPLIKDCYFVNCTFTLNGICNLNFNNCSFKNCRFEGDINDNCNVNFISSILSNAEISNFINVNFYQSGLTDTNLDNILNSKFCTCGFYGDCNIAVNDIYVENSSFDYNVFFTSRYLFLNKSYSSNNSEISNRIFDLDEYENDASIKLINCALNRFSIFNQNSIDKHISLGISNCTLLNPVVFPDIDLEKTSLIYSTILGSAAAVNSANTTKEFGLIANSLILNLLPEDADPLLPAQSHITGSLLPDELAGSYINNIQAEKADSVSLITFSNETAPYRHLNGMIKCLRYNIISYGIVPYELLTKFNTHTDYITPYIQETDIFGNTRSESNPSSGCEEFKAISSYGGTISLDYSTTSKAILKFNDLEKLYQKTFIVNEFIELQNKDELPEFKWTKSGVTLSSTNVVDGTIGVYQVNIEDNGQIISCECNYDGFTLQNDVKLLIAETPILEYESTSYTAWTNTPFSIPVKINTTVDYNTFTTSPINWYIQPKNALAEYVSTSYSYIENDVIKADLNIQITEKTDSSNYFCNLIYLPEGFENSRIIRGVDKNGIENNIIVNIKHNVIIDKTLTTFGDIELNIGDTLTLTSNLIQGDDVIFEWQKTKSLELDSWETIYGPTSNNNDYKKVVFVEDRAGTYYRLHAYNLIDPDDNNSEIATEDYSQITTVKVLPSYAADNSISSNITLFKIPINELTSNETLYDTGLNYRVFSSLDNKDILLANDILNNSPTLHRKKDSDLWEYVGSDNTLERKYIPYVFPSDVDIDKYNTNFGIASEEYRVVDGIRYGGYVYVLDLDHLNDNVDFKINAPQITIDLYSTYMAEPNPDDNIEFNLLGKTVYARNNYIAVADPTAFIVRSNRLSEFDMYVNPRLYSNNNQLVWDINLIENYVDTPIIQLIETETDSIALADIQYNPEKKFIRAIFETNTSIIYENSFRLNVIGKKNIIVDEEIASDIVYINEDLIPDEQGIITWNCTIPETFDSQPLVQLYDSSHKQIITTVAYNNLKNEYVFKFVGTEVIKSGEIYASFVGKSASTSESNKIITKTYYNNALYKYDGKFSWKIKYVNDNINFNERPIVQIYDCVTNEENIDLTKCISNIYYNDSEGIIEVVLENVENGYDRINSNSLALTLIGEKYDSDFLENQGTYKENVGRVLLYKYDGNAKSAKLVKIIKSPNEVKNGYFGESVEFDNHGHILISAPGEEHENDIGYTRSGSDIIPVYKSNDNLTFNTRGKVYVFNLDDLIDSEMFSSVDAKQIISNTASFKTVNYNTGNWGDLKNLYRIQSLYVIKDTATNGLKINEGFSDIESYLEYYDFNYTYDFTYRKYFPTPYTAADFMNGDSRSEYFTIELRQLYYTNNMEERYGTAISYNNDILTIGAPYYNNNKGMIEVWRYDQSLDKYVYSSNIKNPYFSDEKLFGINVETGSGYVLSTFRQTSSTQAVALFNINASSKIENNNITIYAKNKSKASTFGNAMDSYNYTFTIASPSDGEIHRYTFNPVAEYSKYVELIQSIGLSKFGVSASKSNNIVITKDKILASYNSYGPALNDSYPKENLGIGTDGKDIQISMVNSGQGAVLQFTLVGGEYKI